MSKLAKGGIAVFLIVVAVFAIWFIWRKPLTSDVNENLANIPGGTGENVITGVKV